MRDRYRGCLPGGAAGDALGSGIEFLSLAEIRRGCGPAGVTGYVPAYGRAGAITDDTQMTLFTAEGLLHDQQGPPRVRDAPAAVWRAYQRWLNTQYGKPADGWLSSQEFLRHERAPGMTGLSALHAGHLGTVSQPANNSKDCGGVMRVAPAGLADGDPFSLGCQAAALTCSVPAALWPVRQTTKETIPLSLISRKPGLSGDHGSGASAQNPAPSRERPDLPKQLPELTPGVLTSIGGSGRRRRPEIRPRGYLAWPQAASGNRRSAWPGHCRRSTLTCADLVNLAREGQQRSGFRRGHSCSTTGGSGR